MDNRHSVQFFRVLLENLQRACREQLTCTVGVEVSGYLSVEIDSLRKERYVISEFVHAAGSVISESFCTKAFNTTPPPAQTAHRPVHSTPSSSKRVSVQPRSPRRSPSDSLTDHVISVVKSEPIDTSYDVEPDEMAINTKTEETSPLADCSVQISEKENSRHRSSKSGSRQAEDHLKALHDSLLQDCTRVKVAHGASSGMNEAANKTSSGKSAAGHSQSLKQHGRVTPSEITHSQNNFEPLNSTRVNSSKNTTGPSEESTSGALLSHSGSATSTCDYDFLPEFCEVKRHVGDQFENGGNRAQISSPHEVTTEPSDAKFTVESTDGLGGDPGDTAKPAYNDAIPVGEPWSITGEVTYSEKRSLSSSHDTLQAKKVKGDNSLLSQQREAPENFVIVPCTDSDMEEDLNDLQHVTPVMEDDDDDCMVISETSNPHQHHQQHSQQLGHAAYQSHHQQQLFQMLYPQQQPLPGLGFNSVGQIPMLDNSRQRHFSVGQGGQVIESSKHTVRKTRGHVQLFHRFLQEQGETRPMGSILPNELDPLLGIFFSELRKEDGTDYEPVYVRNIQSSLERYLRTKGYSWSITRDHEFAGSRAKLKAKLEQLLEMGKGKGLGSGRKGTLTPRDVNTFYACNQLGTQTPESILNTLWYMVNLHFGIRGPQEHASMVWGDVILQQDAQGNEFLEYVGLSGQPSRGKIIVPADPSNPERCFVHVYKCYRKLRPTSTLTPSSPFYLSFTNSGDWQGSEGAQHGDGGDSAAVCLGDERGPEGSRSFFQARNCSINHIANTMRRMAEACGMHERALTYTSFALFLGTHPHSLAGHLQGAHPN